MKGWISMMSDQDRQVLYNLLQSENATPAQITAARGRLIVSLNRDLRDTNDVQTINRLRNEIRNEMALHQNQLNSRLQETKTNHNFGTQMINEIHLKNRKVANNIRQFNMSEIPSEYIVNGTRIVGNTMSTAFSIAKTPIVATLRLASLAAPVLTSIAVQPLQIPAYLFSKLVNPNSKYNGQIITNMGKELGYLISDGLELSSEIVRRI